MVIEGLGVDVETRGIRWGARCRAAASSRSHTCAIALFAFVALAGPARAVPVSFNYASVNPAITVASYAQCGMTVTTRSQGSAASVRIQPPLGVGVAANAAMVTGDVLIVDFQAEVDGVFYTLDTATDLDADTLVGETLLTGFDANGQNLGSALVSGIGPIDVTASLGVGRIDKLEIAPQGDLILVQAIGYEPATGMLVGSSFEKVGSRGPLSQMSQCGTTLTPRAGTTMSVGTNVGIGIAGTTPNFNAVIDGSEFLDIDFAGDPIDVDMKIRSAVTGTLLFTAFNEEEEVLQMAQLGFTGGNVWKDVTPLFEASTSLKFLRVEATTGYFQLTGIRSEYVPVPSSLASGLAACVSLAVLARQRERRSRMASSPMH